MTFDSRCSTERSCDPFFSFQVQEIDCHRPCRPCHVLGRHVKARIGEGVTGPFGQVNAIYRTPEIDLDPDIFTYNPIAHPHLSNPGELLINYSVNSLDFWDLFYRADSFFPKFIRLILEEPVPGKTQK